MIEEKKEKAVEVKSVKKNENANMLLAKSMLKNIFKK